MRNTKSSYLRLISTLADYPWAVRDSHAWACIPPRSFPENDGGAPWGG